MGVATVAGVGIGDDEGAVVHLGSGGALVLGHVGAVVLLVTVGGEQGAHDGRCLIGHLAQRVRRQVGTRVLID